MCDSSPEEAENWLLSLIQSARRIAEEKRLRCTDSSSIPVVYFDSDYELDALAYLRVLQAYARSGKGSAPQKAEYWVGVLERHHHAARDFFADAYGQHAATSVKGGERKDRRFKAATIVRNLQPTVECYNAIIEAWGHDKDPVSVVRSRRWLSKLEDGVETSSNSILDSPLTPNARSYDLYLHSCTRGLGKHAKVHKERAEEAEKTLEHMLSPGASLDIRPTTESFNYVLRGWTRCRKEIGVAGKVMDLVLRMERIQKEFLLAEEKGLDIADEDAWKQHVAPDTKTYTMALDGWIIKAGLKAEKWRGKELARLNKIKQKAMSRKDGGDHSLHEEKEGDNDDDGTKEMEKAETILKYIHDLDRIGLADVNATVVAYNTLLSGWARLADEIRQDVPLKSEKLLHDMIAMAKEGNENAAPDVVSFNAVIRCWGRTKRPNSADRSEYWLRRMISESPGYGGEKSFMVPPNVQTYNLVMDAYSGKGDPARVQDMILEMDASESVVPNNESFSKVIRAWLQDELDNSQYGLPGSSVENAWNWLQELLNREKKGDVLGPAPELFSSVLKTAARTSADGENMLTVGLLCFQAMKSSRFPPDYLSYCWLLEIALKVLHSPQNDRRREDAVATIFKQCCDDGLLSSKLLKNLARGPSREEEWTQEDSKRLIKELVGDPPFPTTWSRNIKSEQEQPRPSDLVQEKSKGRRHSSRRKAHHQNRS